MAFLEHNTEDKIGTVSLLVGKPHGTFIAQKAKQLGIGGCFMRIFRVLSNFVGVY